MNTGERLKSIRFKDFRGLPDYQCECKGKNVVIFGGNGRGKSCIVDGIDPVCNNEATDLLWESGAGVAFFGDAIDSPYRFTETTTTETAFARYTPNQTKRQAALTRGREIVVRSRPAPAVATPDPAANAAANKTES